MACLHVTFSSYLMNEYVTLYPKEKSIRFMNQHVFFNPLMVPLMSFSVAVAVSILFCMQVWFLQRNETTIESGEFLMRGYNPFRLSDDDKNVA